MNTSNIVLVVSIAMFLVVMSTVITHSAIVSQDRSQPHNKRVSHIQPREIVKTSKDIPKIENKKSKIKKKKTIVQLSKEVIRGEHGRGKERKRSLGNRYKEVQNHINDKLVVEIETKSKVEHKPQDTVKDKPEKKQVTSNTNVSKGSTYLLAQIIQAEANGEPYNGKLAVGNVIMNRVNSDKFPDTIRGVIFQSGQFSPVSNGSIYNNPGPKALQAAKEVLNGVRVVSSKALYFYNPDTAAGSWIYSRTTLRDIGNHRFAY